MMPPRISPRPRSRYKLSVAPGIGILVILLNYVQLLPGATDNLYLLLGLGLILGGIITATQFR